MKKILTIFICGLTILGLTGCGNNNEIEKNNDLSNNTTENNDISYPQFNSLQEITLKDDSTWVVLEDKGKTSKTILLFSTKNWKDCEASELVEVSEYVKQKLEKSLGENDGDTSGIVVRIPTTDDFAKYFSVDFNNYDSINRITSPQVSYILYDSIAGLRDFWVENKLNNGWESNIYCKFESENRYFWFTDIIAPGFRENGFVPIIEISKSNIKV